MGLTLAAGARPDSTLPDGYKFIKNQTTGNLELWLINPDLTESKIAEQSDDGSWFRTAVSTGVGSLHLGGNESGGIAHSLSSTGQNVGFKNEYSNSDANKKIFWFPAWQGVSVDGTVVVNPSILDFSAKSEVEPDGGKFPANLDYNFDRVINGNFATVSVTFTPNESYTGKLTNKIISNVTGAEIYSSSEQVTLTVGQDKKIMYKYPFFSRTGDNIKLQLVKEDGTFLKCFRSISAPTIPYRKLEILAFDDVAIPFGTTYVTSSFTINKAADYEVNTTGGTVTITVPATWRGTFSVSDARQSFSATKPCIVNFAAFGQGNATLQTQRDAYKFFYNTSTSKWDYKDLDTKNGGQV